MAKTIMIVDDSASLRQVVSIALRGAGYDVIEGSDGAGRAEEADGPEGPSDHQRREHAQYGRHHDGQGGQAAAAYKFTPIVMLTTESQAGKKAEGQAAGAKAWVLKPFNPPQLLNVVQKLVLP
jgi:two-component system chemotaxis response regulator CheY